MIDISTNRFSGRPRDDSIDLSILDAAAQIIIDQGYGAATVAAIVASAGTSKPAFYRRFTSVADLVPALVDRRHPLDTPEPTGTLAGDLRAFQAQQAAIFNDPFVRAAMPAWLAHMHDGPDEAADAFVKGFLPQRMAVLTEILDRAAARGEIVLDDVEADALMESFVGTFLMRSLIPGSSLLDDVDIDRSVTLARLLIDQAQPGQTG
ncbi:MULTISPECIES: TetR/AcrR family transcriptional regulator [unclassified Brevibacterium]|uniref:TetR/AcrR family transcriptional regulator n=1 Tax=unclassified Brevibacterium TaxID=2614124 RepID=UPI0010F577AD|nr:MULTISPECIES: TetR/AcrR family transcriptional regulator [unclassified Brevibacterium]MCM1010960.1 TetR/AcrR family transcriptional regulator [Brevibacterium sp. XM4083]